MLPAMTNKTKSCNIIIFVDTIISFCPFRLFQQSFLFIVTNGDNFTSGHFGQFPDFDFHIPSL